MLSISIFVVVITYLIACLYKRWKLVQYFAKKYPITQHHFLTGSLFYIPKDAVLILDYMLNLFKYGKNFIRLGLFYEIFMGISNPADVEVLLSNSNTKGAKKNFVYTYMEPWLGTGLLTSHGEKWYQRRKILTPSFHFSILEQFVAVFNSNSNTFVEKMKSRIGKGEFDIYVDSGLCALDIICEAAMGISVNAQSKPNSEYVMAVKEMSLILQKRFFHFLKDIPFLYNMTHDGKRQKTLIRILHAFTTEVIVKRRQYLITETNNKNDTESKKRYNCLDMLLHATTTEGKPLSNEDIREEVDTFMFEGHDTTASAIAFCFYYLSQNPVIQDKVYQELKDCVGKERLPYLSYKELTDLKYMEMIIKETLRLMPSVAMIGRQLTQDIYFDGFKIPASTNVTISLYAMHRDPDIFPNPEKFDPERFNPTNQNDRNPFAYIPFSAGPRNCIGQKFAMLELKSILAKMLLNYKLLPAIKNKELRLQADLILKSANGVHVILEERHEYE